MDLSVEFNFDIALVGFLIAFGTFSDFGGLVEVSDIILFDTEAAELIKKLVDGSKTDVKAVDDEESHRFIISGRSFDVILLYSMIPSSVQTILCLV